MSNLRSFHGCLSRAQQTGREELKHEVAELKQRLSHYENSNSPPSKNSLLYRELKKKKRKAE